MNLGKAFTRLEALLTRVTSGGYYIPEVDGLRFLAIFPVLIQHLSERVNKYNTYLVENKQVETVLKYWSTRGFTGVFLFFMISGFILGMPFARHYISNAKPISLKSFYMRRLTRLEPPYVFFMLLFFVVLCIRGGSFNELIPHFTASIFYLHSLIFSDHSPINPVTWSLEVEIQFYIFAPLFAWLCFSLKNAIVRRTVLGVSVLLYIFLAHRFGFFLPSGRLSILGNLHYFFLGFILSDLYISGFFKAKNYVFDLVGIVAIALSYYTWSEGFIGTLFFSTELFVLFICVFKGYLLSTFFSFRFTTIVGGMCYTMYLIHLPIAELYGIVSKKLIFVHYYDINLLIHFVIYFTIVLLATAFFFVLIEKPCMEKDWPKKTLDFLRAKRSV
jgi:peptidoglycan/LPS O-acetylase OafA/YrhL